MWEYAIEGWGSFIVFAAWQFIRWCKYISLYAINDNVGYAEGIFLKKATSFISFDKCFYVLNTSWLRHNKTTVKASIVERCIKQGDSMLNFLKVWLHLNDQSKPLHYDVKTGISRTLNVISVSLETLCKRVSLGMFVSFGIMSLSNASPDNSICFRGWWKKKSCNKYGKEWSAYVGSFSLTLGN